MKIDQRISTILFFILLIPVVAHGTQYSKISRIPSHGGTIELLESKPGFIKIRATDDYGTRIVGPQEGFTYKQVRILIERLDGIGAAWLICLPLGTLSGASSSVAGALSFGSFLMKNIASGTVMGIVSIDMGFISYSVLGMCKEYSDLNRNSGYELQKLVESSSEPSTGSAVAIKTVLNARYYWALYDRIDDYGSMIIVARNFHRQWN